MMNYNGKQSNEVNPKHNKINLKLNLIIKFIEMARNSKRTTIYKEFKPSTLYLI